MADKNYRERIKKQNTAADEIRISDDEMSEASRAGNPYYDGVARRYSAARYALLIFLVIFMLFAALRNPESISYDNLMFLLKDLGSVHDASNVEFGNVTYNPDTTLSFSGFRRNLAIATSAGLRIYEGDGSLIFEGKDKFSNPHIENSSRYLLLYDFGGNSFALYNSFARIYTEKTDYEITGGDISDSGMFAIVTKTKEYNSAVMLYTKNCKLKNRYLSEDRVIDVSINDDGSRICILTFDAENSSFVTKIKISKPGEDKPITTLSLGDAFPLSCEYTSDGNLTVFCDKALYFYDPDGNLLGSYSPSGDIEAAKLTEEGAIIALPKNAVTTGSTVILLDTKGNVVFTKDFEGKITLLDYKEGKVFTLAGNMLASTDVNSLSTITKKTFSGGKSMVVYSEDDVFVCSGSYAEYFDFSESGG